MSQYFNLDDYLSKDEQVEVNNNNNINNILLKQQQQNSKWLINYKEDDGPSCSLCGESFNKSRKNVKCIFCDFDCCLSCMKKYLFDTKKEAHCMNCRKDWSFNFLIKNTPNSFYNVELRNHRAKILLEQEHSLLPEVKYIAITNLILRKFHKVVLLLSTIAFKEMEGRDTKRKLFLTALFATFPEYLHRNCS